MAKVQRKFTLELTIEVSIKEDEHEINHDKLQDGLQGMFPVQQVCVIGGEKITAKVTLRRLNRNY